MDNDSMRTFLDSHNHSVLVIDDNPANLGVIVDYLSQCGFRVMTARTGKSGIEMAQRALPDVILLDVMMPGIDGFETCRRLKADEKTSLIPVIFMTVVADVENKIKGFQCGAVDYVTKPFQNAEVLARVTTQLRLRELTESLEETVRQRTEQLVLANQELSRQIAEREAAERQLRATAREKELILNSTSNLVTYLDTDLKVLWANRAVAETYAISTQEMVGKYCHQVRKEDQGFCKNCPVATALEKQQPATAEVETSDGRVWLIRAYPVKDEAGHLIALAEFSQDITAQKRSEAEIRRRNRELTLLNRVIAASLSATQTTEILDIACRELTHGFTLLRATAFLLEAQSATATISAQFSTATMGPDSTERERMTWQSLIDNHPDQWQTLFEQDNPLVVDDVLYDKRFAPFDHIWNQRKTRACMVIPLHIHGDRAGCLLLEANQPDHFSQEHAQLIQSVAGQVSSVLTRIRMGEEHLRLETQYAQAQKMEAIGRLTGGVAHDFNNILTIILGVVDLMQLNAAPDPLLQKNLGHIQTASRRAADLVSQLLAFSRQQILQPRVIDLNETIPNIDKLLQRLIGEDIHMETILMPDLGQVKADPGQIEQVIMNLAINAQDAMPNGGKLTLETANVDFDEQYAKKHVGVVPGRHVMLAVSDTGIGMDKKTLERVFDPFFTTKPKGKGTGLGLASVHGIVKQSGGHIWVYSEPGRGTSFKIYLPRIEAAAESQTPKRSEPVIAHGSETILVVEDETPLRQLFKDILSQWGYKILHADSGESARAVFENHDGPIHLLLTDVVIPGGENGRQLSDALTAQDPRLKTIFMSGYTNNAIVHSGVLDPDIIFLQKPFLPSILSQKIREALDEG